MAIICVSGYDDVPLMKENNIFGDHVMRNKAYSFSFCNKTVEHWVITENLPDAMS